jgi:lipoprotein NlpI
VLVTREKQRYYATHSEAASATTAGSLDKMLQGISVESTEAEAIMYLAVYYTEHDDFDSAAS